jgi:hypothetical protein
VRQIRTELKEATHERKEVDLRIKRLRTAEAALYGERTPNAKILNRELLRDYLTKHPGSRSIDIADDLQVPAGSVRNLLSTMKRANETTNNKQLWYLASNGHSGNGH